MRLLPLIALIACTETAPQASSPAKPATSPTPTKPASPVGDVKSGAKTYATYCIACHQADGSGKPAGGAAIAGNFVGENGVLKKSDEDLLRTIKAGKTGRIGSMPPWAGVLSKQQRLDVLAYIRKTFGEKP